MTFSFFARVNGSWRDRSLTHIFHDVPPVSCLKFVDESVGVYVFVHSSRCLYRERAVVIHAGCFEKRTAGPPAVFAAL